MPLPMTYSQLVIDYPQIATTSAAKQREIDTLGIIAQSKYFCAEAWGEYQEQAIVWYLLHTQELAAISQKTANGTLQAIKLEDDGEVRFHKAEMQNSKNWTDKLNLTYYGGLLLDLYNTLFPAVPVRLAGVARGYMPVNGYGGYQW